jgi:hypothetical protein
MKLFLSNMKPIHQKLGVKHDIARYFVLESAVERIRPATLKPNASFGLKNQLRSSLHEIGRRLRAHSRMK